MAFPYSKRQLVELIAGGHDTKSAARLFRRSEEFIKAEQNTAEYKRFLEWAIRNRNQQGRVPKTSMETYPVRVYSTRVG